MRPRPRRLDPNTVQLLKHIGVGLIVLAVVGLFITGVWYGTRLPALTITEVRASGGETIEPTEIERVVEEALDGTYLGLVPRRFAWLYPEEEIFEKVSTTERIFNVGITREGTALLVTYDEYVPFALWCGIEDEAPCVFVDKSGYAFGHAPKLTGGSFLRFRTAGRDPVLGEQMADGSMFITAQELVRLLETQEWYVSYIEIDQVDDMFIELAAGGELKVNSKTLPTKTMEDLLVILTSEEFSHLRPGNFQYIDLRFGEKVFVNEELAASNEEIAGEMVSSTPATTSAVAPE